MAITLNTLVYSFTGFINGGIARFLNQDAGSAAAWKVLTSSVNDPNVNGDYKVRWKLQLPTVVSEEACGCPGGIQRVTFADIIVTVPKTALAAERAAIALSLKDLCANAQFQASITSLQTPSS